MLFERTSSLTHQFHRREIDITPRQLTIWKNFDFNNDITAGGRTLLNDLLPPHITKYDLIFLEYGCTPEEWDRWQASVTE